DGERGQRLAAAALADDAQGLAALQLEVDAAHGMQGALGHRDVDGEVVYPEDGFAHGSQPLFSAAVTSRRPSPRRWMAGTRTNSATPGMAISQGSNSIICLPSEIIRPQDGVGGCTPRPRNDSAASSRIAWAISSVATTIRLLTTFGMISRRMMRRVEQPIALAALTYSRSRTCSTEERMTTANRSHSSRPSTQTTTCSEPPRMATTASATSTTGMARRTLIRKVTTRSTRPPK